MVFSVRSSLGTERRGCKKCLPGVGESLSGCIEKNLRYEHDKRVDNFRIPLPYWGKLLGIRVIRMLSVQCRTKQVKPQLSRVDTFMRDSEGCASSLCKLDPSAVGVWPAGPAAVTVTLASTCGIQKRKGKLEISQTLVYVQHERKAKTKPLGRMRGMEANETS